MATHGIIPFVHETARSFLDNLRCSNDEWLESHEYESRWIFRGQRDAEWGLRPSAWLSETQFREIIEHYKELVTPSAQRIAENVKARIAVTVQNHVCENIKNALIAMARPEL